MRQGQYGQLLVNGSLGHGEKNVASAGTAEALGAENAIKRVHITAKTTNSGTIWVGGSGVTTTGTPLSAGDSMIITIDSLSEVFVNATVSGEGVTYSYVF